VDVHNVSEALAVVGEVAGRHCIIVDDIIDTAGTVANAAQLLQKKGALSVRVLATHGVLSDPAIDRLKNAPIEEVVVTNSIPTPAMAEHFDKLTVLSIAPIVSEALQAIFMESSVSEIFLGENA
jgi:ribose-phosphate pyrophosphokinase